MFPKDIIEEVSPQSAWIRRTAKVPMFFILISTGLIGGIATTFFKMVGELAIEKDLTKDGWFSTELLPPGYRLKQKRSERSFLSLTPAFNQLRTMRELFDNLRHEGHSQETVAKIKNNYR